MSQKIETVRHPKNRKMNADSKAAGVPSQKRKEDAKKPLYINRI